MRYLVAIILMFGLTVTGQAQNPGGSPLVEERVWSDSVDNWGPNRSHFAHLYVGAGQHFGVTEDAEFDLRTGASWDFLFGARYKRRLSNHLALGADLSFSFGTYALEESELFSTPTESEHFEVNSIGLEGYVRLNFDKRRGDHVGNWLDLGGYGHWHWHTEYRVTYEDTLKQDITIERENLVFKNEFSYGLSARFGFNRWIIYGRYRLSDIFDPTENGFAGQLPRWTAGVQIGLHQ